MLNSYSAHKKVLLSLPVYKAKAEELTKAKEIYITFIYDQFSSNFRNVLYILVENKKKIVKSQKFCRKSPKSSLKSVYYYSKTP